MARLLIFVQIVELPDMARWVTHLFADELDIFDDMLYRYIVGGPQVKFSVRHFLKLHFGFGGGENGAEVVYIALWRGLQHQTRQGSVGPVFQVRRRDDRTEAGTHFRRHAFQYPPHADNNIGFHARELIVGRRRGGMNGDSGTHLRAFGTPP